MAFACASSAARRTILSLAARDGEEVREQPRARFLQAPSLFVRPELSELGVAEAGAHADVSVVSRHIIAADQEQQRRASQCRSRSPRLAGDEAIGLPGDGREQRRELALVKMMQEQVREHHVGLFRCGAHAASRTHRFRRRRHPSRARGNPARVRALIDGARSTSTARTPVCARPRRVATLRRSVPSPAPSSTIGGASAAGRARRA